MNRIDDYTDSNLMHYCRLNGIRMKIYSVTPKSVWSQRDACICANVIVIVVVVSICRHKRCDPIENAALNYLHFISEPCSLAVLVSKPSFSREGKKKQLEFGFIKCKCFLVLVNEHDCHQNKSSGFVISVDAWVDFILRVNKPILRSLCGFKRFHCLPLKKLAIFTFFETVCGENRSLLVNCIDIANIS